MTVGELIKQLQDLAANSPDGMNTTVLVQSDWEEDFDGITSGPVENATGAYSQSFANMDELGWGGQRDFPRNAVILY